MEETKLNKKERRALRRQEKIAKKKKQKRGQMIYRTAFWSLIVIGAVGIIFAIAKFNPQTPNDNTPAASVLRSIVDGDWTKGSKESTITLIEYSDLQCPACATYYPVVKQLSQEFENDITFVYRHFPLKQIHPKAELAARAAESAGKQNKFWEMHDMIFEKQNQWIKTVNTKETFIDYARTLNLDVEQFKTDIESQEIKEKVNDDYSGGIKLGIQSVPSFFLNGKKLSNPRSYEEFRSLIQKVVSENQL